MLLSLQGHSAALAACACIASRVSPEVRIVSRLKPGILVSSVDDRNCQLMSVFPLSGLQTTLTWLSEPHCRV